MGQKLLWTGLAVVVALGIVLNALDVPVDSTTVVLVGAIIMVVGLILLWFNK